jgi:hypothetical protein
MPTSSGGSLSADHLLSTLPIGELTLLEPELERVALPLQEVLQEWGEPLTRLWFPCSGVASVVSRMADGNSVKVATTGREGMVGLSADLGASRLAQPVFIQIPETAFACVSSGTVNSEASCPPSDACCSVMPPCSSSRSRTGRVQPAARNRGTVRPRTDMTMTTHDDAKRVMRSEPGMRLICEP